MACTDCFWGIAVFFLLSVIKIYRILALGICTLFLPLTKYFVNKVLLKYFNTRVNGPAPTDPQIINERSFYTRVAVDGSLGILESYADEDWEVKDLHGMAMKVLETHNSEKMIPWTSKVLQYFNLQTAARAFQVGEEHYDKCNPVVFDMTGKYHQYTCGYWKDATDLDTAQVNKMELIAKKLMLKPGMRVLDIGSGYGTLGHYLAKNYGVSFEGCTVSEEHVRYAIKAAKEENLDCKFVLCDYRDYWKKEYKGKFDRIVSVGMMEHVGHKNLREFFKICRHALKDDGILLAHLIGLGNPKFPRSEPFTNKYIFPNFAVPYDTDLAKAYSRLFLMEDWQNFGYDYYRTIRAWGENFEKVKHKHEKGLGKKWMRIWKIYHDVAPTFWGSRSLQLYQIVLSKNGIEGGYYSPR